MDGFGVAPERLVTAAAAITETLGGVDTGGLRDVGGGDYGDDQVRAMVAEFGATVQLAVEALVHRGAAAAAGLHTAADGYVRSDGAGRAAIAGAAPGGG
jgi:hypothetical protein